MAGTTGCEPAVSAVTERGCQVLSPTYKAVGDCQVLDNTQQSDRSRVSRRVQNKLIASVVRGCGRTRSLRTSKLTGPSVLPASSRRSSAFSSPPPFLASDRHFSDYATLLPNHDARTKVNAFRIYVLNVRAQIGPVMSKITGQTV